MDPIFLYGIAFACVAGMVVALASLLKTDDSSKTEERLDILAGRKAPEAKTKVTRDELFREGVSGLSGVAQGLVAKLGNLPKLLEQAQSPIGPDKFLILTVGLMLGSFFICVTAKLPAPVYPLVIAPLGLAPLVWMILRRNKRFKKFGADLPEALALVARALRSGSSLAAGLKAVVDEMEGPVAEEFGIAYEQQNFGIPIDQCLKDLYLRLPNMDFKFFATAVSVQKQAGGDLSEVLDKISELIRERFRIQGQVKALTGEGRISGIMLTALPVVLFLVVLKLNPEYVMTLFTEPLGQKMMCAAIFLQVVGAFCIKKMVEIKI